MPRRFASRDFVFQNIQCSANSGKTEQPHVQLQELSRKYGIDHRTRMQFQFSLVELSLLGLSARNLAVRLSE